MTPGPNAPTGTTGRSPTSCATRSSSGSPALAGPPSTLTKEQLNYRMALQHAALQHDHRHPALDRLHRIFADRAAPAGT
jgi:hypothetical protein